MAKKKKFYSCSDSGNGDVRGRVMTAARAASHIVAEGAEARVLGNLGQRGFPTHQAVRRELLNRRDRKVQATHFRVENNGATVREGTGLGGRFIASAEAKARSDAVCRLNAAIAAVNDALAAFLKSEKEATTVNENSGIRAVFPVWAVRRRVDPDSEAMHSAALAEAMRSARGKALRDKP